MNALRPIVLILVAAASSSSLVAHQSAPPVRRRTAGSGQAVDQGRRFDGRDGHRRRRRRPRPRRQARHRPQAHRFELYEEKVLQDVGSFTPVNRAEAAAATTAAAARRRRPRRDRREGAAGDGVAVRSPDARCEGLAYKAASTTSARSFTANNVVAVFGIDLSLMFYQPFTRDGDLLRKAFETRWARHVGVPERPPAAVKLRRRRTTAQAPSPRRRARPDRAAASTRPPPPTRSSRDDESHARAVQSLESDEEGYSTANALLAIVSAMKSIPGRKSMVSSRRAVDHANVSPVHVGDRGWRPRQRQHLSDGRRRPAHREHARRDPRGVGARVQPANSSDRQPAQPSADDQVLETTRPAAADPHSGLGMLADQTGGFLIANSNDLARRLRQRSTPTCGTPTC